jgi:hypothetical protein
MEKMQALAKRTEPKPLLQNKVNQTHVAGFAADPDHCVFAVN